MTALFIGLSLACPAHAADFTTHVHRIAPPQKTAPLVFEDENGQQHALSDFRGRYLLLNVWATWCAPCVREMPSLDDLQKQMGPQLAILPLSEDRGDQVVTIFFARHKLHNLFIAIDHAGIAPATLHLKGLPTTLLINPQGFEVARIEGDADWASPEALQFLRTEITAQHYP